MKVQNSFMVWALLPLMACSAKDESDDSTDGTAEVEEQSDVDDADSNADADAGDASDDTGAADEEDADSDGEDTGSEDTAEEEDPGVSDFEVAGVYEGEFSITLTIPLPPVVATCAGDVTFVVDEESEPSISGTGACSFDEDGGLAPYVDLGLLDDVGPFEGETTGELLEHPNAEGSLVIDTSIGEISPEWTGTFAEAIDADPVSFNGEMVGTVELDLSDLLPGLEAVAITYDGSFETTWTGEVPEGDEDTGETELP